MHWVHIAGPAMATIAFWLFGKGMVRRAKGYGFQPLPVFIFLLVTLAFRFLLPSSILVEHYHFIDKGGFFDRLCLMFADIGLGMVIASLYLRYHKEQPKLFFVPGVLALLVAAVIYGFTLIIQSFQSFGENRTELLVELGPDDHIDEVKPTLKRFKAHYVRAFPNVDLDEDEDLSQTYLLCVDTTYRHILMDELQADRENVDHIALNHPVNLIAPIASQKSSSTRSGRFLANDPYLEKQWHAQTLHYNDVYARLDKLKPVRKAKLAIVDTGVDAKHEDIRTIFKSSPGKTDKHSHGTHCAGIAGAATNNGIGVGSLNWEGEFMEIRGYQALDQYGRGTDETVAQAIIDAAEGGADIISMSLGGYHPIPPRVQSEAIQYARELGCIVIVAAGNSNDDARKYSPANIPGVIVVGAVDQQLAKAPFSNINTQLKMPIAAPGVDILSAVPNDQYQPFSGTSMATPMVAGLATLIKAFQPDLDTEALYDILKDNGQEVKDADKVGRVIDPLSSLEAVLPQP